MSNIPHRYQTPEEEIKTGKGMIVFFSITFTICIILAICFLFDDSDGWILSLVILFFAFVSHLPGILAGKQAMENGKKREKEKHF